MTTNETWDDAIHIVDPRNAPRTLCAQEPWQDINLTTVDKPRPDWFSGCWTCITKANAR